jgi:hypothetical protein
LTSNMLNSSSQGIILDETKSTNELHMIEHYSPVKLITSTGLFSLSKSVKSMLCYFTSHRSALESIDLHWNLRDILAQRRGPPENACGCLSSARSFIILSDSFLVQLLILNLAKKHNIRVVNELNWEKRQVGGCS